MCSSAQQNHVGIDARDEAALEGKHVFEGEPGRSILETGPTASPSGDHHHFARVDFLNAQLRTCGEPLSLDLTVEVRCLLGAPGSVNDLFDVDGQDHKNSWVITDPESGKVFFDEIALGRGSHTGRHSA